MATPQRRPRPPFDKARTFIATILCMVTLAVASILLSRTSSTTTFEPRNVLPLAKHECQQVHQAKDQCKFVQRYCIDEQPGLLSYLDFYYCSILGRVPGLPFVILTLWLALLFTTIGIAASDFFSINLSTISSALHLPESLAGVTFLAFGNGSPDVFSTFAAMNSNSGSMALGELIGAASFITAVVAGSMALIKEFTVNKKTFVRDILFFITAISFTMVFVADGKIHFWECAVMIGFYAAYVVLVVTWHYLSTRRKRRHDNKKHALDGTAPVVAITPYQDDPDHELTTARRLSNHDGSSDGDDGHRDAEAGVRFDIDETVDEMDLERHIAAEMTNSMRVNRPRRMHSHSTAGPIRPSLIGALEFRSVLASLQKERNLRLAPLRRSNSDYISVRPSVPISSGGERIVQPGDTQPTQRERALSSGDIPANRDAHRRDRPSVRIDTEIVNKTLLPAKQRQATSSPVLSTRNGLLAPPTFASGTFGQASGDTLHDNDESLSTLSAFPLLESPAILTPGLSDSSGMLPLPALRTDYFDGSDPEDEATFIKWWPYSVFPPPQLLSSIMFPTLQDWKDKSIWTKIVSIISAPMIFLLVITLPVVESEALEDQDQAGEPNSRHNTHSPKLGALAPPVTTDRRGSIEPETEWEEYQRRTRSHRRSSVSPHGLGGRHGDSTASPSINVSVREGEVDPFDRRATSMQNPQAIEAVDDNEPDDWNRWLLVLQLFTGPLFSMLIIWTKYLSQPINVLVKMSLFSLLASSICTALLLLATSPLRKPKYHFVFCFLGFAVSIMWISTIAEEVVGILKAVGIILGWSDAILGLTVFAMGNSVSDLVADITVARLGYPFMALSACFGGPMLNILLGIGIGGMYMTTSGAHNGKGKHGNSPGVKKGVYHLEISASLFISAITVLITLLVLLFGVPLNGWTMNRKIGLVLVAIWTVGTVINVVVESTGVWKDVAWEDMFSL